MGLLICCKTFMSPPVWGFSLFFFVSWDGLLTVVSFLQGLMNPLYSQPFAHYNTQPLNMQATQQQQQQQQQAQQGPGSQNQKVHYNGWEFMGKATYPWWVIVYLLQSATWSVPAMCDRMLSVLTGKWWRVLNNGGELVIQLLMNDSKVIESDLVWCGNMGSRSRAVEEEQDNPKVSTRTFGDGNIRYLGEKISYTWLGFVRRVLIKKNKSRLIALTYREHTSKIQKQLPL